MASGANAADYVMVPGGRFESVLPQSAQPGVSVAIQVAPFLLRVTPVTAGEFLAFARTHPQWLRDRIPSVFADRGYLADWSSATELNGPDAIDRPQTHVSWFAARVFCESEAARLPLWIEWEFAAAADETRPDARSDPQWRQHILSWYERPSAAPLPPVGGTPNAYGVRDLHGLIWEWVEDFNSLFISEDSRTQGDPDTLRFCGAGAISVLDRDNYAMLMRIALLSSLAASDSTSNLGFRCARPIGEN